MRDTPREFHLPAEAFDEGGRFGELAAQHLERHHLVELSIARPVDRPHSPATHECQDFVTTGEQLGREGVFVRTPRSRCARVQRVGAFQTVVVVRWRQRIPGSTAIHIEAIVPRCVRADYQRDCMAPIIAYG